VEKLLQQLEAMRHSTVYNYISPGLKSSMVGEGKEGGTVRLMEAERDTIEFPITPHSHRYDFTALVLYGVVENSLYYHEDEVGPQLEMVNLGPRQKYAVGYMEGVLGDYKLIRPNVAPTVFVTQTNRYTAGATYGMKNDEVHSIRFYAGTKVLMFEGPRVKDKVVFLEPWVEGEGRIETFRNEPWMFRRGERS
jgi:hypothetical protein